MKERIFNKIIEELDTDRSMDQRITNKLMNYDESSENMQVKNPLNFTTNLFGRLLTNRLAKAAIIVIAIGILGTATVMASRYYVKSYKTDYIDPENKDISSPPGISSSEAVKRGEEAFAKLGLPNLIPVYLFDNYKLLKEHFSYTEITGLDGKVKKNIVGDFVNEDNSKNVYLEFTPLTTSVKEIRFEVKGLETSTYTTGSGLTCNLEIDKKNDSINVNIIYDSEIIGNALYSINFIHVPVEEVEIILDSIPINTADDFVTSYAIDYSSDTEQIEVTMSKEPYKFEVSDSASAKYGDQIFSELNLPNLFPSYLYDKYDMDQEHFIVSEEPSPDGTMDKKITADFYSADQSKSVNIRYIPSVASIKAISENSLTNPSDRYVIKLADEHPERIKDKYLSRNGILYSLEIDKESDLIESALYFDSSVIGNAKYFITFYHVPLEEVKEILDSIPISSNNVNLAYSLYYYNSYVPESLERIKMSYGERITGTIDYNSSDDIKYGDEAFTAIGLPNLIPTLIYDNYYLEQEKFHVTVEKYPEGQVFNEIAAGFWNSDFSKYIYLEYCKLEFPANDIKSASDLPDRDIYTTQSGLICNLEVDKEIDSINATINFDSDVIGNAQYFITFTHIPMEEAKAILESIPMASVEN